MISIWCAFCIDLLLGDPYWFPHPVRLIGWFIGAFEKAVRKLVSSDRGLKLAGVLLTTATVLLSYGIAYGILWVAGQLHPWAYWVAQTILLWTCMALRCLHLEGAKVYKRLADRDLEGARKQLSYLVARETRGLDEQGVARGAVETVVENTSDGMIAPLFYMLIGGAPLAMAYKAVNTLDSMVGYKNERYLHFGWASARLDDVVNYIPARLTGGFMVLGAWIMGMDYRSGLRVMIRDHGNHQSPNAAYPEAAAAGILGIQLGGANYYFGKLVEKPTIGDDTRPIVQEDIVKAIRLMYGAAILTLVVGTGLRIFL